MSNAIKLKDFLTGTAAVKSDDAAKAARERLQKEAEENWGDARWHREQAALIAEAVDMGFKNPEVFTGVLKFHTLGREDKLVRKIRKGLKVYTIAAGGYVDESTIHTDSVEAPRSPLAWHVVSTPEEALADYAETLATLVSLAKQAEQVEIVRRQLTLLQEAAQSGDPNYAHAGSGLTPEIVKAGLRHVADAERPTGGIMPADVTIIGRAAVVDQVSDFTSFGFAPNVYEQINETGYVGRFRGAKVVRLANFTDGDGTSYMPEDELWIVSNDAGDYANFGAARINNWTENSSDKTHWKSRRETGGYITIPDAVYRITV